MALTHWEQDILKQYGKCVSNLIKLVRLCTICDKPVLVDIWTRRRTGDRPPYEQIIVYFTDAYMRHSALMWVE